MTKSYTIKIICTEKDLTVLEKALESYQKNKDITKCLLALIKYQKLENERGVKEMTKEQQ